MSFILPTWSRWVKVVMEGEGRLKKEGRKKILSKVCVTLCVSHTHVQCVGLHTSLPLWHHRRWRGARDNREELNTEGKLSLSLSVGWTGKQDVNTLERRSSHSGRIPSTNRILLCSDVTVDSRFKMTPCFTLDCLLGSWLRFESLPAPVKALGAFTPRLLDWITLSRFPSLFSGPKRSKTSAVCTTNIYSYGCLSLVVGWRYSRVLLVPRK